MDITDNEIRKINMMCRFEHAVENLYYAYNGSTLILKYLWYYYIVKDANIVECINKDRVLVETYSNVYKIIEIMNDREIDLTWTIKLVRILDERNYLYENEDSVVIIGKREEFRCNGSYLGHYHFGDRCIKIGIKDNGLREEYIQYNLATSKVICISNKI